jgi:hypothetical protein
MISRSRFDACRTGFKNRPDRPADRRLIAPTTGPEGGTVALGYRWERATFPWLMTWEENRARQQAPWNGRTLVRGLEFGSYAFATSRRANVERGTLLGQPCFEWLDAYEVSEHVWAA